MRRFLILLLTGLAACGLAAPTIRIMPYDGARFVEGQLFDVRVEFKPSATGKAIENPTMSIGGKSYPVKMDAFNGFTLRAVHVDKAGDYTIEATATEAGDAARTSAKANFRIEAVGGRSRRIKNIIICLGDGMGIAL